MLEFEQLLKIHLADAADTAAIRANRDDTLAWAREQNEANLATARAYAAGEGVFPSTRRSPGAGARRPRRRPAAVTPS